MAEILNFNPAEPAPVVTGPSPADADGKGQSVNPTESDALKAGEGAKTSTLSGFDPSAGSGSSAGGGARVSLGGMMESKLAIELMDSLIPALLVVLFRYGKMIVKKAELQLTAKEKETLAPVVQACMDQLMLNFNSPWVALAFTGGMIYGSKIVEIYGTDRAERKTGPIDSNKAQQGPFPRERNKIPITDPNEPVKPPVKELRPWNEDDIQKYVDKKKCSKAKAREYFEKNWVRKGGLIT